MSGALSPTHWLIIVGVLVLLFGAKKLPDVARGVGQSLRIFKSEMSPQDSGSSAVATGGQTTEGQQATTGSPTTTEPPPPPSRSPRPSREPSPPTR